MKTTFGKRGYGILRNSLLTGSLLIPISGLLAASALNLQHKKPPAFPLSLFAQATEDDYIGESKCVSCHKPWAASFERSAHASYVRDPHMGKDRHGCESCHGPGKVHLDHRGSAKEIRQFTFGFIRANAKQIGDACLRCHADTLSESHWRGTGHARADISCIDCHRIHQPEPNEQEVLKAHAAPESIRKPIFVAAAERRPLLKADEPTLCGRCHRRETAEFRHNYHHPVPEGRMICSDCHDVHPSKSAPKRIASVKDSCVTCHADKSGPFVFEHDMIGGGNGDGCNECHRPHGSPNPRLLNAFSRGLCNQCHTDKSTNHFPGQTCWTAGCHVGIHGSNTDAHLLRR